MKHRPMIVLLQQRVWLLWKDDDEDNGCDGCGCEVLPELGGWGSKETVREQKLYGELSTDQRRKLEQLTGSFSTSFRFYSVKFNIFATTPISSSTRYEAGVA
ncbi:hypothetical protein PoB_000074100 [Plakobranchus ocellatus]|uniref:Uncharacterized protein n=1 Tax=Plakobranchus ocellatus TaxID=259542 RepID=A0AAV3XTS0_9GAST|nr:hypothetical protein PoB_000074100 [Plakobranchus ocellatus]